MSRFATYLIVLTVVISGVVAPVRATDDALTSLDDNFAAENSNDKSVDADEKIESTTVQVDSKIVEPKANSSSSETPAVANSGENISKNLASQNESAPPQAAETPVENAVDAAKITEQPSPIVANGDVLISAFQVDANYGFTALELRNTSDKFIDLSVLSIELRYASPATDYVCELTMSDFLRPQSFVAYHHSAVQFAQQALALPMNGCAEPHASQLFDREIIVSQNGEIIEAVRISASDIEKAPNAIWERKGWTASSRTGVFAKNFQPRATDAIFASELYKLPEIPALEILEILPNPTACSMADLRVVCEKYVKIKNTSDYDIDLSQYRLRAGDRNDLDSLIYNVSSLSEIVPAHGWTTVSAQANGAALAINKDAGTVWFQDAEGLENYENSVTPYDHGDTVAKRGQSWAYNSAQGIWQWTTPNPSEETNIFEDLTPGKGATDTTSTLKPCAEGQYRNPETNRCRSLNSATSTLTPCKEGQYRSEETNRCRSIAAATSTLKPCKEGQYRSEETNRCRSIAATAAATLKPCADDQFRNPATGRCKKIASTDDVLQPCKDGWERNPETNRCRKIKTASVTTAEYPVEPIEASSSTRAMWWAIGGLAAAGTAYAAWEWRPEISRGWRRVRAARKK